MKKKVLKAKDNGRNSCNAIRSSLRKAKFKCGTDLTVASNPSKENSKLLSVTKEISKNDSGIRNLKLESSVERDSKRDSSSSKPNTKVSFKTKLKSKTITKSLKPNLKTDLINSKQTSKSIVNSPKILKELDRLQIDPKAMSKKVSSLTPAKVRNAKSHNSHTAPKNSNNNKKSSEQNLSENEISQNNPINNKKGDSKVKCLKNKSTKKGFQVNNTYENLSFDKIEEKIFEGVSEKYLRGGKEKRNQRLKSVNDVGNVSAVSNSSDTKLNKKLKGNVSQIKPNKSDESHPHISTTKIRSSKDKRIAKKEICGSKKKLKGKPKLVSKELSDSDVSDLEDVDELTEILCGSHSKEGGENVQIELEASNVLWGINKKKHRTREQMIEDYVRKHVNRSIKEVHENMHKTHLLCLLAHGMYVNSVLNSEPLLASALSIIPKLYFSPKRFDMTHLEKFLSWFVKLISVESKGVKNSSDDNDIQKVLEKGFEVKVVYSFRDLVRMFVVIARTVGMNVRLVHSLYPLSWKPSAENLFKPNKADEDKSVKQTSKSKIMPTVSELQEKLNNKKEKNIHKMISSDSECSLTNKKKIKPNVLKKMKQKPNVDVVYSDEDDFEEENVKSKTNMKKGKTCERNKRKSLDTNSSPKKKMKKENLVEWAEVYLEEEEKWIPVDVARNKIHCASEIEARSPPNLAYVVAYNPDQTVKDVTKRYVSSWLSYKDKIQCDGVWWTESLTPFTGKKDKRSRKEDKELEENLKMQPLPKTINEYKNHPLYALQRHLLKFEAIYPPDVSPVGFIRGEPVFPRDSVKNLNGRETWFKEAKVVRVGEEPYKIVKARPKWDRVSCQLIKGKPLEIFGDWQVEDYDPPTAKNGKVPRNEYGNVDLFKPCMLPKGCVHIPLSGLNRVARKLNIDCAPAMVGFDYHAGSCHPVYDGFVVCREVKNTLLDAYKQDQIEQAKKDEEKRMKRIYGNWKKLINGILLKERIKEKYGTKEEIEDVKLPVKKEVNKSNKRKIKQEDLDTLSSSLITHSVVNLKIDMTSVCERNKNKKIVHRRKRQVKDKDTDEKVVSRINERKEFDTKKEITQDGSLSSESEEDALTEKEKQEKIRNILKWNPDTALAGSDPDLSGDDSENEDKLLTAPKLESNKLDIPSTCIAKPKIKKSPVQKSKRKKAVKKSNDIEETGSNKFMSNDYTSHSDSSETLNEEVKESQLSVKRRSVRLKKGVKEVKYAESDDESKSDITIDDSDADVNYNPQSEKSKFNFDLNLSDESN